MAHKLEIRNGHASMAYAGEVPWHGLGKLVLPDLTPQQMLKEAGLDWKVELIPSYVERTANGIIQRIPTGMAALVRDIDGAVLTNAGLKWNPVQNEEAADFFQKFVMAGQMEMHTAGSLMEGQRVWFLAKVKKEFGLFRGKDVIESYLLFSLPHLYGESTVIKFTPTRVVCWNTLSFSLGEFTEDQVRISHRRKFDAEKVMDLLGLADAKMDEYKEQAVFLGSKKTNAQALIDYFTKVFPGTMPGKEKELSRNARLAMDQMDKQPGAELGAGTWWQPFNAATFTVDHLLGSSDDLRLNSAWFGRGVKQKHLALLEAVKFAQAA